MSKAVHILFVIFCTTPIFCQTLWEGLRDINHHECDDESSTQILSSKMGPCLDTLGCSLPDCCGIVSGRATNISFTYKALINMNSATRYGEVDSFGLGLGSPENQIQDPLNAISVPIPQDLLPHNENACDFTTCPQVAGEEYTLNGMFQIPTSAVTTLTFTGNFNAKVISDDPGNPVVYCKAVYVRIVNADLLPAIIHLSSNSFIPTCGWID